MGCNRLQGYVRSFIGLHWVTLGDYEWNLVELVFFVSWLPSFTEYMLGSYRYHWFILGYNWLSWVIMGYHGL